MALASVVTLTLISVSTPFFRYFAALRTGDATEIAMRTEILMRWMWIVFPVMIVGSVLALVGVSIPAAVLRLRLRLQYPRAIVFSASQLEFESLDAGDTPVRDRISYGVSATDREIAGWVGLIGPRQSFSIRWRDIGSMELQPEAAGSKGPRILLRTSEGRLISFTVVDGWSPYMTPVKEDRLESIHRQLDRLRATASESTG